MPGASSGCWRAGAPASRTTERPPKPETRPADPGCGRRGESVEPATGQARPPANARAPLLVWGLLFATVAPLLGVTWAGASVLSALRAYVAGEGLYSKGQKDAVYHLVRYTLSRDELEYERYRSAIAVPLADARARRELERPDGSLATAEQALIEGRNDAAEAAAMAGLFPGGAWLAEMQRAIRIWDAADSAIARLDATAGALRAELGARGRDRGDADPARIAALLAEIEDTDQRLTELEDSFSSTLGAGARRVHRLVLVTAVAASASLLAIGALSTGRLLRRIRRRDERFRSMIENAQDVITIVSPDGRLVYNSPAVERVLGYPPEALAGRNAFELIHREDHAPVLAALRRTVA